MARCDHDACHWIRPYCWLNAERSERERWRKVVERDLFGYHAKAAKRKAGLRNV